MVKSNRQLLSQGNAHLRIALLEDELIGFCWAQQLNKSEISQAISKVKYVQSLNVNNIEEVLNCFIDDGTIIYLHDLGIVESFRGKISLYQLIYPVIQSLSIKSKTQRLFFWSIENTRINNLAKFSGFNLLTTIKGMQFFMGDINNSQIWRFNQQYLMTLHSSITSYLQLSLYCRYNKRL